MNQYLLERAILYVTELRNRREEQGPENSVENPAQEPGPRKGWRSVLMAMTVPITDQLSKLRGKRHIAEPSYHSEESRRGVKNA